MRKWLSSKLSNSKIDQTTEQTQKNQKPKNPYSWSAQANSMKDEVQKIEENFKQPPQISKP